MFPKVEDGRVDPLLTNILLADMNPSYLADEILPTVPNLKNESGIIPGVDNAHLRVYRSKRSLYDTGQHRVNFEINKDNRYDIEYFDLEAYIPDRLQQQLQSPFDARKIGMMTTMEALRLERETGLAAALTDTAILTRNITLSDTSQYTDTVNSTPDTDFDTARDSVQQRTGREANSLLMNREVANALRRHPFFLEIAQSVLKGGVSKVNALSPKALVESLKAWYGLKRVLVGSQIKITTQEGQSETKAAVWGNDVVWFYRPDGPALMTPSFGYSFQLAGKNRRATTRREPIATKGDLVGVEWAYQDNIIDVDSAYLIKDAI